MVCSVTNHWTTENYRESDRYEVWDHKLKEVYGQWSLQKPFDPGFNATITYRNVSNFQIVECRCDPCGAFRSRVEVSRDDHEMLAVQLVLDGREEFCIGNQRVLLNSGDVLLWDTTKPMTFRVVERLHKISTMVPLSRLRHWLPGSWQAVEGKVEAGSVAAKLLSNYFSAISPDFMSGHLNNGDGLVEATIGLLINALGGDISKAEPESLRGAQLVRVHAYINRHIEDLDLTPAKIADACRISVRYLHWLFEPTGTSVLKHVIQQRLMLCRRALANPMMAGRTITEIAFSSGFSSSTHFARRFKAEYGVTPQEFRQDVSREAGEGVVSSFPFATDLQGVSSDDVPAWL